MLAIRPKVIEPVFSLYARPLHPEFFDPVARRTLCRNFYEATVAITNVGHVLIWTDGQRTLTEVMAPVHHELPRQTVFRDPILGERQEAVSLENGLSYRSNFRLEPVEPETLFLLDRECSRDIERDGLVHRFGGNGRVALGAVSYVRLESRLKRLYVRSVHTFPDDSALVRTETVIELTDVTEPPNGYE